MEKADVESPAQKSKALKSKARKQRQKLKRVQSTKKLQLAHDQACKLLQTEKKKTESLARRIKVYQRKPLPSKIEQRPSRPNLNRVTVSGCKRQQPRQLPPSLFYYDEADSILGEGTFGKCLKAYMQGTCVCLKQIKQTGTLGKMSLMHEASILTNLCHSAVCFVHGIQSETEPYYLVMTLYSCHGFSITIHDLLHPTSKDTGKTEYLKSLQLKLTTDLWCFFMTKIVEGLQYIHSRRIIHRDLKPNNVIVYQKGPSFDLVLADFGKSISFESAVKYKLTETEKKQYHELHKHIAPDVIDGIYAPSSSSDIYSYGWICKNILHYSSSKISCFDKRVTDMVSNCLKYHSTERPSAAKVVHTMKPQ